MTTDTIPKAISRKFFLGKHEISCTGIAKGSGMINPNMATMLGFIFLDVNISKKMLNCLIHEVVERTFNLITVDGDTSTNDSFLISCSNLAKNKIIQTKSSLYIQLRNNLMDIAGKLAEMIIRDGEGATKFIKIEIKNAKNIDEVKIAGKAIANSPLVKTAFFASDPNLGRILSALGNISAFNINTNLIDIKLNNNFVVQKGKIAPSYSESKALKAMKAKEFMLSINLKRGKTTATVLTTDLSYEYIKINAEYRT
jgi:glutamate N-acetyltransferase/amino-acid N-acetyltransferase